MSAMDELTAAVGPERAAVIHKLWLQEYATHIRAHMNAAVAENPGKAPEKAFFDDILARSEAEAVFATPLQVALADAIRGKAPAGPRG